MYGTQVVTGKIMVVIMWVGIAFVNTVFVVYFHIRFGLIAWGWQLCGPVGLRRSEFLRFLVTMMGRSIVMSYGCRGCGSTMWGIPAIWKAGWRLILIMRRPVLGVCGMMSCGYLGRCICGLRRGVLRRFSSPGSSPGTAGLLSGVLAAIWSGERGSGSFIRNWAGPAPSGARLRYGRRLLGRLCRRRAS